MEKEGKKVILSSVYSGRAIKVAISKLSPDKLILVRDGQDETKDKTIENLKEIFKGILKIEIVETNQYDMADIIKKANNKINKEFERGNEILTHITEGRKITSLALLFSSYMNKEKVSGAYYITQESNKILPLPLLELEIGKTKKEILQNIKKGNNIPKKIQEKLGIKQSATYQHINELKREGYIQGDKELNLTNLGEIVVV